MIDWIRARRVLPLGIAVIAFWAAWFAAGGPSVMAATKTTPQVIVLKSGLTLGGEGSDFATYGLVLRNRSKTFDALNVTVTVKAIDAAGRAFTSDQPVITVIPAASSFAVDGSLAWDVSLVLKRISVTVHVGRAAPKGEGKLPPVTHISVNDPEVTASLTNIYRKPLQGDATIYAVFFDSAGKIVNEDDTQTGATLSPGETVPFDFYLTLPTVDVSHPDPASSALMSVDPCDLTAGTVACPVAGSVAKF